MVSAKLFLFFGRDMSEEVATKSIIEDHLPAISRSIRLGEISVDNIDVFCEKGVFEIETTKRILQAGRRMGFRLNFHADELTSIGAGEVRIFKGPLSHRLPLQFFSFSCRWELQSRPRFGKNNSTFLL